MNNHPCTEKHSCTHIHDRLQAEREWLRRSIPRHKWYRGIPDDLRALESFIDGHAESWTRNYCAACVDKEGCEARTTIEK